MHVLYVCVGYVYITYTLHKHPSHKLNMCVGVRVQVVQCRCGGVGVNGAYCDVELNIYMYVCIFLLCDMVLFICTQQKYSFTECGVHCIYFN